MTDVTTERDQEPEGLSAADVQLLRELTERARAARRRRASTVRAAQLLALKRPA